MRRYVLAPKPVQNHVAKILHHYRVPMLSVRRVYRATQVQLGPIVAYRFTEHPHAKQRFVKSLERIPRNLPIIVPDAEFHHMALMQDYGFAPIRYCLTCNELTHQTRANEAAWELIAELDVLRHIRDQYRSQDL